MELKKHISGGKTCISYTLCGDYYLPDLVLSKERVKNKALKGRK